MNSKVQIDEDQARAELATIEAEQQPPEAAAPDASAPGPAPAVELEQLPPPDWTAAAAGIVTIFDRVVAPNWQLELEERDALRESLKQVLVAFFPDPFDPRVQACLALAGTMFVIAQARVDPATGKVRPMRVKKPAPPAEGADAAARRAAA